MSSKIIHDTNERNGGGVGRFIEIQIYIQIQRHIKIILYAFWLISLHHWTKDCVLKIKKTKEKYGLDEHNALVI